MVVLGLKRSKRFRKGSGMDSTETRLRDAKLGAAVDNAAGKLPEGWQVIICIMQGGYSVGLLDPFGNDYELSPEDEMVGDINNAVSQAIAADNEQ